MHLTAHYIGSIDVAGGTFMGVYLGGAQQSVPIRVLVTFEKDDHGTEVLEYQVGQQPEQTLFLAKEGQYEISTNTLHPLSEAAGPATLGFLLPPTISKTFARPPSTPAHKWESQCGIDLPTCRNVLIRSGFASDSLHCMWNTSDNLIRWNYRGTDILTWKFTFEGKPVPSVIQYFEYDPNSPSRLTSRATYTLKSLSPLTQPLKKEDYLNPTANIVVMKGRDGYGPLDKRADPWAFYATEDKKFHQREGQTRTTHSTTAWVNIGLVAFGLLLATIFIGLRLAKAKKVTR